VAHLGFCLVAEAVSVVLPSLPPLADDYRIAVCAACKLRSCLLECHRCATRKNGDPGQVEFTVAELRASGSQEHHSYWRSQPGENHDLPHGVDDLRELAEQQRKEHTEKPFAGWSLEEHASLFAGYVTEAELGIHRGQARNVLRAAYPEAADSIEKWLGTHCCVGCQGLVPGVEIFGKAGVSICSVCDRRTATAQVSVENRDRLILAYIAKNGGPS
jgi:hypothetical protein